MPINISELKVQFQYKTVNNQERIILDIIGDNVIYVSRGGNVENSWCQKIQSTKSTFATACEKTIGIINIDKFNEIKLANNY